jgi:CheY-like chemotaxis protein
LLLLPDYDVVAVSRAVEALGRLSAGEQFDVILCDLMMPEMNGIEFSEQLGHCAPDHKGRVVFLTGGAFTDETRLFLAAPGRAKLEKPFTERALRTAIEAVIARGDSPPAASAP